MSAEIRCILDPFKRTCPLECGLNKLAEQFTQKLEDEFGPKLEKAGIGLVIDIRGQAAKELRHAGRIIECKNFPQADITGQGWDNILEID